MITWYLFEPVANLLTSECNIEPWWAFALAPAIVFVIAFAILQLLFWLVEKYVAPFHTTVVNKLIGMLAGITMGVTGVLLLAQYSTVTMPAPLQQYTQQWGLHEMLAYPIESVNARIDTFPFRQPMHVMAVKTDISNEIKEGGVKLSFSTTSAILRPDLEAAMLDLINSERSRHGLRALKADTALTRAARLHSSDMLARGYFSHNTPEGVNPFQRLHKLDIRYRYAGENLALAPTLTRAHNGLIKSPGHRANILHRSYGRAGIGILDTGSFGLMVTQEFRD